MEQTGAEPTPDTAADLAARAHMSVSQVQRWFGRRAAARRLVTPPAAPQRSPAEATAATPVQADPPMPAEREHKSIENAQSAREQEAINRRVRLGWWHTLLSLNLTRILLID